MLSQGRVDSGRAPVTSPRGQYQDRLSSGFVEPGGPTPEVRLSLQQDEGCPLLGTPPAFGRKDEGRKGPEIQGIWIELPWHAGCA